jgi:uncharacterized protein
MGGFSRVRSFPAARVKSGGYKPGTADLERLEHIRTLLTSAGHDVTRATLGLFSTNGFSDGLSNEAARSSRQVLLAGLEQLYGA